MLEPEVYNIAFEKGTEPPFSGEYYKNKEDGMYHCGVCEAPLFSSENKYDSGSGWPSFDQEASGANIERHEDRSHGMVRTEVTCGSCGAHLGHVFNDGPDSTGERFCINSAVLDFQKGEAGSGSGESEDSPIGDSDQAE